LASFFRELVTFFDYGKNLSDMVRRRSRYVTNLGHRFGVLAMSGRVIGVDAMAVVNHDDKVFVNEPRVLKFVS
jgi:hypothetical protein